MKNLKSVLKVSILSLVVIIVAAFQFRSFQAFRSWTNYNNLSKIVVPEVVATVDGASIRVALLLDTSNSMDGLIEQAKSRLWEILAELGTAQKGEVSPTLLISLYEYGNDGLSQRQAFIRQVLPFTTDMDLVSKKLFELTTNGGEEYCGAVIGQSLQDLEWGNRTDDLRLIYIAGNEGFNQGPVDFTKSCARAVEKDVVINTIFCGPHDTGIALKWQEGAQLGKGTYSSIDQNQATVYVETPYDDTILKLNSQLNDTYIAFGKQGTSYQQNQIAQDKNADTYGQANTVNRALFKSSKIYSNTNWDLVDAYRNDKKIVTKIKEEELPENFRGKDAETKVQLIEAQAQVRDSIQAEIAKIKVERSNYIQNNTAPNEEANNLGASILEPLRKKAAEKGFKMEGEKKVADQ